MEWIVIRSLWVECEILMLILKIECRTMKMKKKLGELKIVFRKQD